MTSVAPTSLGRYVRMHWAQSGQPGPVLVHAVPSMSTSIPVDSAITLTHSRTTCMVDVPPPVSATS